jgi:bifunctional non-homologous end joining protein LigD
VALWIRDELRTLGLRGFAKTSGALGTHVVVPLAPPVAFDRTKAFARDVSGRMVAQHPDVVTTKSTRALRPGRVLVDWLQNDPTRMTVAPYSLRATDWPSVSSPVTWDEVEEAVAAGRPESLVFLAGDVLERIDRLGDLMAEGLTAAQTLR